MDVLRHIRFFATFFKISAGWQMCGALEVRIIIVYQCESGITVPICTLDMIPKSATRR